MSSKRRNIVAWLLILAAAVCWGAGKYYLNIDQFLPVETTHPSETAMTAVTDSEGNYIPTTEPSVGPTEQTASRTDTSADTHRRSRGIAFLGYSLCVAALTAAALAIFWFRQIKALLGPDGVLVLWGLASLYLWGAGFLTWFTSTLVLLLAVRELWGWVTSRGCLSWCALHRLAKRCPMPQLSLAVLAAGILLPLFTVAVLYVNTYNDFYIFLADDRLLRTVIAVVLWAILSFCCLMSYGTDLRHFEKQLKNFREGNRIDVGSGTFSEEEQLLLNIRTEHEEAVKTAVTSERFKVELISNVSHDLRTPLTSILGYAELLQKETLTDTGKEQLTRLNQKAGYMRDLVESLFELTKVSSGVLESKKEQIDLIRLLEQTVGLFDDQLTAAGLEVRRHYSAENVPVCTDGARMHQVFANLLGNAIKYALTGTRIHLEVKDNEEHYSVRMVNTASYDMDFEPEQILQRFARGDKARTGQGSGLGLAIAQTYTESVGGSFSVNVDGDQFSAIVCLPKN